MSFKHRLNLKIRYLLQTCNFLQVYPEGSPVTHCVPLCQCAKDKVVPCA